MNLYKRSKILLSLILSLAIVISGGVLVEYPSGSGGFLGLNRAEAATEYTTLKKTSDGTTIQIPVQAYSADTNGDGIGDKPYKYIEITDSGTWSVPTGITKVDVFLVGGGGAGKYSGGGGGYTTTALNTSVAGISEIPITIGQGGQGISYVTDNGTDAPSGTATIFGNNLVSANGGKGAKGGAGLSQVGGDGGSGGGGYVTASTPDTGSDGGSDGCKNPNDWGGGNGQGSTTRDFLNRIHAGGGGGCGRNYGSGGNGGIGINGNFGRGGTPSNRNGTDGGIGGGKAGLGIGTNGLGGGGGGGYGGGGGGAGTSCTSGSGGSGFCMVRWLDNKFPTITIFSPTQNEKYFTDLPLLGTVIDQNVGDVLTVKYKIDNEAEQTILCSITSDGTSKEFNSDNIDISALSKTSHTISVWVTDDKGAWSQIRTITFIKDDTVKLSVSTVKPTATATSVDLNISDISLKNTHYQIACNNSYITEEGTLTKTPTWIRRQSNLITSSSINVSGLEPETKYTFHIKSRTADGANPMTYNTVTYTTPALLLPKVSGIQVKADFSKIIVSWRPIDGASFYAIEADGAVTTTAALSYIHNGLSQNTMHSYRVMANNSITNGQWSDLMKAKTTLALPSAPLAITTTPSGTTINISWQPVPNSIGYEIEVDGHIVSIANNTNYKHSVLKPMTQHSYRVRAEYSAGVGPWSALKTEMTTNGVPQSIPTNITYKQTDTTITITWNEVLDAETYEIEEVANNVTGQAIDNGTATSCEIKGLLPNTTHTYMIRARNSCDDGQAPWGKIVVTTYSLGIPGNIIAVESDKSIKFTWDSVKNAEIYTVTLNKILSSGQTQTLDQINGITSNTYTWTNLDPETEYTYSIKSQNSSGESAWSDAMTATTLPIKPEMPTNVSALVTDITINIKWNEVASSEGYDIDLNGVLLENDNSTTYKYVELMPNTLYKYRVRARNSGVEGDWSEMQEIRTMPGKPQIPKDIQVKSTQTGANVFWQPEPGAIGYDLEISQLQDDGTINVIKQVSNISNSSYTHRKLNKGEEYRYRIRTKNIQGFSAWSGYIINNAIKAECKKNNTVDLGLTVTDVIDFSSYEMVVTYNSGVVEVVDLSTLTGKLELATGRIEGTEITIKEFTQGRIVFVVDKAVTPGEAWTGVINGIKFKAKETGGTTITYTVLVK